MIQRLTLISVGGLNEKNAGLSCFTLQKSCVITILLEDWRIVIFVGDVNNDKSAACVTEKIKTQRSHVEYGNVMGFYTPSISSQIVLLKSAIENRFLLCY